MTTSVSHSLEDACSQNSVILLGAERFAEEDVASNGTGKNPGLLRSVRQLSFDLDHTTSLTQFSQDGTEE